MTENEKQNGIEEELPENTRDEEINEADSELHRILYGGEYSEYGEDLGSDEEEEEQPKMKLRTFASKDGTASAKKTKTESKKKLTLIIVISAVIVAAVALVLVFAPGWFKTEVEAPPTLYDGEVLSGSKRVMMFEQIPRERIQTIEVHNQYGDYTAYYNAETESFGFLGLEGTPYNEELFSQLVVASGFPLISDRFLPTEERAPLEDYGLGENDEKSYYIITTRPTSDTPSVSYKVYIGKPSLTENYYYCMVEGRDIVYILEQSIKTTLLADVKSLLTPILTYPIEDNSYLTNISDIIILKDGGLFAKIVYQDTEANVPGVEMYGVTVPYLVTAPVEYDASTQMMTTLLGQIVNMTGSELLEYNIYDTVLLTDENGDPVLDEKGEQEHDYVMKPEIAETYGFVTPAHDIYYCYITADGTPLDNMVSVSALQHGEDGSEFYYVASMLFNTIAKIDASSLSFLEWPLMEYLDKPVFSVNIDKVSRIKITTSDKNYDFELTGTGDGLVAVESANGRTTFKGDDKDAGTNHGIRNFRKFYQTILSINREDFTEEPHEDERALLLQLDVTFRDGSVRAYKFYSYSERRCFMTVNDKGEFYVLRSMIRKLVSDADKLLSYQTVNPNADN